MSVPGVACHMRTAGGVARMGVGLLLQMDDNKLCDVIYADQRNSK